MIQNVQSDELAVASSTMRKDLRRNLSRLIEAAGEVVRRDPDGLTMPAVAAEAGLAVSTAWRHFSSVEELTSAYTLQQLRDLQQRCNSSPDNEPLFQATLSIWVDIVLRNGPAMVQFRSKKGYLERLHEGDEVIGAAREVWEPAVEQLIGELGLVGSILDQALFLANSMFDPREILDLHAYAHMGRTEIVRKLSNAYRGTLEGWVRPEG